MCHFQESLLARVKWTRTSPPPPLSNRITNGEKPHLEFHNQVRHYTAHRSRRNSRFWMNAQERDDHEMECHLKVWQMIDKFVPTGQPVAPILCTWLNRIIDWSTWDYVRKHLLGRGDVPIDLLDN